MSGLFSQVGVGKEKRAQVATTAGDGTAGVPNTATVTTAAAHNLRPGDVVVIAGVTPSGYNGSWAVSGVPSSTTFTIQTGTALLAAITVQGTVDASAYGVGAMPSRFFEFVSENVVSNRQRIESAAIATGNRVQASSRFAVNELNATGDLVLEVSSKGFGFWLEYMLGKVTTTGPTDSAYTHTAAISTVRGKSLTYQKLLPEADVSGGVNTVATALAGTVLTYLGCKVSQWELSNSVDGMLMLKLSLLGRNEVVNVPLAAASYPTGPELLSFLNGDIQVDGESVANVKGITISCDLKLAERRFVGPATRNGEPLEASLREFKASLDVEFNDTVLLNKFRSATAAGSLAAITATWTGAGLIGAATYPSLTVSLPNFRVDGSTPTIDGPGILSQKVDGPCLNTSVTSADACSIVYVTTDTTP